jgi:predicted nucleic acid-binding protein
MLEIWELAEEAVSATHGYVEGHAAIARRVRSRHGATARALLDDCWEQMQAVPIDDGLIVLAARVAGLYRLRAHDAIHLAAAVQTGPDLIFVSWDNELAAAARSAGLETLPAW